MTLISLTAAQIARKIKSPSVSVVIPALNEERNLPHVFARMPRHVAQVILVDGGSTDRTVEVARQLWPSITVVRQTRTGKGNALACGFAVATGDIIVMIDADGSTDPAEIPSFVRALVDGADFAKGTRFGKGGGSDDITALRRMGNAGLNGVVNVLFGTRFTDLCYGYNAFWRRLLPSLDLPDIGAQPAAGGRKLWGDGFEIETLINVRVAGARLRIEEVPSHESPRLYGESNLSTFRDGMRVLRTVLTEYRRNRRWTRLRLGAPAEAGFRQRHMSPVQIGGSPVPAARPALPAGLEGQIEALRALNRHRNPSPSGYATATASGALGGALSVPELGVRYEEG